MPPVSPLRFDLIDILLDVPRSFLPGGATGVVLQVVIGAFLSVLVFYWAIRLIKNAVAFVFEDDRPEWKKEGFLKKEYYNEWKKIEKQDARKERQRERRRERLEEWREEQREKRRIWREDYANERNEQNREEEE